MKLFSKIFLFLAVSASALTSCKKDKDLVNDENNEEAPQTTSDIDPGKGVQLLGASSFLALTPEDFDPQNSMSITMVVEGLETSVQEKDKLVAYFDGKCCGVATPYFEEDDTTNPRLFLLVSIKEEDLKENPTFTIELCYYSTMSKKLYTAKKPIIYETNARIGSYDNPYSPEWQ